MPKPITPCKVIGFFCLDWTRKVVESLKIKTYPVKVWILILLWKDVLTGCLYFASRMVQRNDIMQSVSIKIDTNRQGFFPRLSLNRELTFFTVAIGNELEYNPFRTNNGGNYP